MIKHVAEMLIKKLGTNCPFAIAKELNITICYEELGSIMGYFSQDFRFKFIHINQSLSQEDSKFTCAHELGHAILHPKVNTPFLKRHTLFSVDKIEKQANTFAVELLMPDSMFNEGDSIYSIAHTVGIPKKLIDLKAIKKDHSHL